MGNSKKVSVKDVTDPKILNLDNVIAENIELKAKNKSLMSEVVALKDSANKWKPMKDAPHDRVILTDLGLVVRGVKTGTTQDVGWCLCDINGSLDFTFTRFASRAYIPEMGVIDSFLTNIGVKEPPASKIHKWEETKEYHGLIVNPKVWKEV